MGHMPHTGQGQRRCNGGHGIQPGMNKDSANLDLLRALAVGMVVSGHIGLAMGYEFQVLGRVGVAIFFVHTSLVLMLSLERAGPAALPFFVRRFFRIYPLSAALVLLVAAGHALGGIALGPGELLSNLLLVQNISGHEPVIPPMWSLPYEIQMYLVLPAIFVALRVSPLRRIWLIWAASIAVISAVWLAGGNVTLIQYLPCFLPGILAFVLAGHGRGTRSPLLLFGLVGAGAAMITWLALAYGAPTLPMFWLLCLLLGVTIPACREIDRNGWLAKAASVVAKYSYSLYLTHLFAIHAAFWLFPGLHWALKAVILLAVMLAWARVAYRWIEAPGIALGARLALRCTQTRPGARSLPASRWFHQKR